MTELQAARLIGMNGLPQSCHPMLTSGRRASYGLPSPSLDVIQRGDPITVAYGVQGALNARAGFLAESAAELPPDIPDYVERLVAPYFAAVVDWYETLGIGVTGGALWKAVHDRIGDPFFGVSLNPGHLIHLDEWMHSPVFEAPTSRCAPAWRCRSTSSRRPARPGSPPTSRTASRWPTRRCAMKLPHDSPRHGPASRRVVPSWPTSSA